MISLQEHLFFLIEFKNLTEVSSVLDRVSSSVTFWGKRVLKADGYSGSISIDKVTKKILKVPVVGYYWHGFSQSMIRDKIIRRLDELYLESDHKIVGINCFSKCLAYIRSNRNLRNNVEGQYFPLS